MLGKDISPELKQSMDTSLVKMCARLLPINSFRVHIYSLIGLLDRLLAINTFQSPILE